MKYSRNVNRNPLVPVRVRGTNAKFCSVSGVRSFWIDPRCAMTITDYTSCVWDKSKQDLQKYGERGGGERWLRTHLADADGYMIDALCPMGQESAEVPREGMKVVQRPRFHVPEF